MPKQLSTPPRDLEPAVAKNASSLDDCVANTGGSMYVI